MPCQLRHPLGTQIYFIFSFFFFSNISLFPHSGLPRPVAAFGQDPEHGCHQFLLSSPILLTQTVMGRGIPCVLTLEGSDFLIASTTFTWHAEVTRLTTNKPDALLRPKG